MTQFTIQAPSRQGKPLRIGLYGLDGTGKTYSALLLALGLTGGEDVVLADTENGGAAFYGSLGNWAHLPLDGDYNPEIIMQAVEFAINSGAKAVVLDSLTSAWAGPGGVLDIADSQTNQYGKELSGLQKWKKPKQLHRDLLEALIYAPCHIIFTCKLKRSFKQIKDERTGKDNVVLVGFEPVTDFDSPYSTDINLDLSENHSATVTKDRTQQLPHQPFVIGRQHGEMLAAWLGSGGAIQPDVAPGKAYSDEYVRQGLLVLGYPVEAHAKVIGQIIGKASPDDIATIDKLRARVDALVNERNKQ